MLSAAFNIFCEKGYDNTSINDIISRVGVTKGAFYYYFKSKEDILQILADSQVEVLIKITQQVADNKELNAIEKINLLIEKTHEFRYQNISDRLILFELLKNESNSRLVRKISEEIIKCGKSEMLRIIEQGIEEGLFDIQFPDETAEYFIQFSIMLNSEMQKIMIEKEKNYYDKNTVARKLSFFEETIVKILGIKHANINLAQQLLNSYSLG